MGSDADDWLTAWWGRARANWWLATFGLSSCRLVSDDDGTTASSFFCVDSFGTSWSLTSSFWVSASSCLSLRICTDLWTYVMHQMFRRLINNPLKLSCRKEWKNWRMPPSNNDACHWDGACRSSLQQTTEANRTLYSLGFFFFFFFKGGGKLHLPEVRTGQHVQTSVMRTKLTKHISSKGKIYSGNCTVINVSERYELEE